jgi:membrane protein implicated in regulation of membrane protease activity
MSAAFQAPSRGPGADAVTILLAVVGVLMLLPGVFALMVCATVIARDAGVLSKPFGDTVIFFVVLGLIVSLGGLAVLWGARRRHRRRLSETSS